MMKGSVFLAAEHCLSACDPEEKTRLVEELLNDWLAGQLSLADWEACADIGEPGRPPHPQLVNPLDVPRRRLSTQKGRAALIHAIAHIEFNAINLALDAICRFRGMPAAYYGDWLRVAAEEARHFKLLQIRLRQLGCDYGGFTAHDGLWNMARKTAHDSLLRMALVPRVLEARGLDVTPGMIARLEQAGDRETVAALNIILRDEIGHVAIGSRWFKYLCHQRNLEPEHTFQTLLGRYLDHPPRGPFNEEARLQGGFSEAELSMLRALDQKAARIDIDGIS